MTGIPAETLTVPALLLTLAVTDGAFAGFRAGTGRNARIRKRGHNLLAARRGVGVSLLGVSVTAVVILAGLAGNGHRHQALIDAGARMLVIVVPYALAVVVSLAAYWLLPIRESTFVILIGLGSFTLARPAVVTAATVAAVLRSADWFIWVAALAAAAGVLTVEPLVHHRWYREPL